VTTVVDRHIERLAGNPFPAFLDGVDAIMEVLLRAGQEEVWLIKLTNDLVSGNPPLPLDAPLLSDGSGGHRA
jgi:hypothetical protein